MDYINLKIFKDGDNITFMLSNALKDEGIIAVVTELMTRDNDGLKKRCFQDGNDIIIEMYGLSKSVDSVIADIINKTASCRIHPETVTGLTAISDDQCELPKVEQMDDFVPELLSINAGEEINSSECKNNLTEDTKKHYYTKYPNLNRINCLKRHEMVQLLKEVAPRFEYALTPLIKERKKTNLLDFIRLETDTYLRMACYSIAESISNL